MPQLTIDLNQLGLTVDDGAGWVETVDALGRPLPIASNAGTMVLGSRGLDFSTEGLATITLPSTDDLEPAGARYRVYITRRDTITAPTAVGPFTLTTNANLDEVAELPPAEVVAALQESIAAAQALLDAMEPLESLAAQVAAYADHGDVSGAVTFSGPTASHWFAATGPTTITLNGYTEGQVCSLLCFSGADNVTVAGASNFEVADGLVASAMRARGTWVAGGGGEPVVPDTTPPSAVTDLSATGGQEEIVLGWSPATDAESAVSYRYRAWLTSGGATGAWATTTSTAATITGLAAGAYTAEVYAYSAGGASATDTTPATVTAVPGWSVFGSDDFTGTDGAVIKDRTMPVGGLGYSTSDTTPIVSGNKAIWTPPTEHARITPDFPGASAAAGIEITLDAVLVQQANSSYPYIDVNYPNTPNMVIERTGGGLFVKVIGYDVSNVNTTLVAPVSVTSATAITFRRTPTGIEILEGDVSKIVHDFEGRYSGYIAQPNPTSVDLIGMNFQNSSIDNLVVRMLT